MKARIAATLCIITVVLVVASTNQGDSELNEIIFKLKENVISAEGLPERINPSRYSSIIPNELTSIFREYNVSIINKLIPEFMARDTLSVNMAGRSFKRMNWTNVFYFTANSSRDAQIIFEILDDMRIIEYVDKNEYYQSRQGEITPNDELFHAQWNMYQLNGYDINAKQAWSYQTGSPTVKVAVIDNGIWRSHPDLSNPTFRVSGDLEPPTGGHGTAVAGILATGNNNEEGVAGVDWKCEIFSKNIYPGATPTKMAQAIDNAIDAGVDILNISQGGGGWNHSVKNMLIDAWKSGIFIVVANPAHYAGYPANDLNPNSYGSYLTNVQAVSINGLLADYSTIHLDFTDFCAPGGNQSSYPTQIWTAGLPAQPAPPDPSIIGRSNIISEGPDPPPADPDYPYIKTYGTSIAAPHVSGVAALLIAENTELGNESLTNYDLEWIMRISADPMAGAKSLVGAGRLDASAALSLIQSPYTIEHQPATLTKIASGSYYFASDPFQPEHYEHRQGEGNYFVDVWLLDASYYPSTPYLETPDAWLSQTGYVNYTNPAIVKDCIRSAPSKKRHL